MTIVYRGSYVQVVNIWNAGAEALEALVGCLQCLPTGDAARRGPTSSSDQGGEAEARLCNENGAPHDGSTAGGHAFADRCRDPGEPLQENGHRTSSEETEDGQAPASSNLETMVFHVGGK